MKRVVLSVLGLVIIASAGQIPAEPHLIPDTFATYVYTTDEIMVFSYGDDNTCEIRDSIGVVIASDMLMEDEYLWVDGLAPGVYQIQGSGLFSVITGNPMNDWGQGWYAVDGNSRPLSTKLLTLIPKDWAGPHAGEEKFCVFSYYDNTDVIVRNIDSEQVIWEGSLDSVECWCMEPDLEAAIPVSVEASRPVSALSYSDCGYYVPAFNGTFTGKSFQTYCGEIGVPVDPWPNALKIIAWEDDVNVVVTDLQNPYDTVWEVNLAEKGSVESLVITDKFLSINADKRISCAYLPSVDSEYYHMIRSIDFNGLGIGSEFFVPAYHDSDIPASLNIIAFADETEVMVESSIHELLWQGTLHSEEVESIATEADVYHVTSEKGIMVVERVGDMGGADFMPQWWAIHPGIAVVPSPQYQNTSKGMSVPYTLFIENNGNSADVINLEWYNSNVADFTIRIYDPLGGILPDTDADERPDTDTLTPGSRFEILVEITSSTAVEIGDVDTCYVTGISSNNPSENSTGILITEIIEASKDEVIPEALIDVFLDREVLYVLNPEGNELTLNIFDVSGSKVQSSLIVNPETLLELSKLPSGVYFVSLWAGESEVLKRKIVLK